MPLQLTSLEKKITWGVTELGSQEETIGIRVGPKTRRKAVSRSSKVCQRHQKLREAMEGWFSAILFATNTPSPPPPGHLRLL